MSRRVTIDLLFPPTDVRLARLGQPLSAGRQYEVSCEAAGARPDPRLTWWLARQYCYIPCKNRLTSWVTEQILCIATDNRVGLVYWVSFDATKTRNTINCFVAL